MYGKDSVAEKAISLENVKSDDLYKTEKESNSFENSRVGFRCEIAPDGTRSKLINDDVFCVLLLC